MACRDTSTGTLATAKSIKVSLKKRCPPPPPTKNHFCQNDAACRVIARLVRERDEARVQMQTQRTALAQAQAAAPAAAAAAVEGE